ncbi:MAG: SUMF1/EgtB/PvdO family nonheme iron enzyme [Bacteroidota bacterium]
MRVNEYMFLLLLNLIFHQSAFPAGSRYESGYERAYFEVSTFTTKTVAGKLVYRNNWYSNEGHSAVWLFAKDKSGHSISIDSVIAFSGQISYKLSKNRKGVILINPSGTAVECIDVKINFSVHAEFAKIHVLEMVLVNEGAYDLGCAKSYEDRNTILTGKGTLGAPLNAFYQSDVNGNYAGPYKVKSEATLKIGDCMGCLYAKDAKIPGVNTYSGEKAGRLPASFPKGFTAFYQMRYELSEAQYCDFLNSLTDRQSTNRINLAGEFQGENRRKFGNFIRLAEEGFITTSPLQPCSFLSWSDCLAYADWAGLRIMTELEFEKSARGFNASKFREFCWGDEQISLSNGLILGGSASGTKVAGNAHINYLGFSNYADVCPTSKARYRGCRTLNDSLAYRGPITTGIHAYSADRKDRSSTGASYFGAMDLSGNLREPVVPIGWAANRRGYTNHLGDGSIDKDGNSNETAWKFLLQEDTVFGYRGGGWSYHENHGQIADRFNVFRQGIEKRTPYAGFRGVVGIPSNVY